MKFKNLGGDPPIFLQPEKLNETEIIFISQTTQTTCRISLGAKFLETKNEENNQSDWEVERIYNTKFQNRAESRLNEVPK